MFNIRIIRIYEESHPPKKTDAGKNA